MRNIYLIGNVHIGGGAELQMRLINQYYKELSSISTLRKDGLLSLFRLLLLSPPGLVVSFHRRTDIIACILGHKHDIIIRESNSAYAKDRSLFERIRIILVRVTRSRVVSNNFSGKEYWERSTGRSVGILPNLFELPSEVSDVSPMNTLIVGRLEPHKAVYKSILFADRLGENINVIGDGSLKNELVAKTKGVLKSKVNFLGFINQESVYNQMTKSKNLVHLSDYEGYPNVIIQAKLRGMIVYASKNESNLINIGSIVDYWVTDSLEVQANECLDFNAQEYLKNNYAEFKKSFEALVI